MIAFSSSNLSTSFKGRGCYVATPGVIGVRSISQYKAFFFLSSFLIVQLKQLHYQVKEMECGRFCVVVTISVTVIILLSVATILLLLKLLLLLCFIWNCATIIINIISMLYSCTAVQQHSLTWHMLELIRFHFVVFLLVFVVNIYTTKI